jgi:hypothetical protein
MKICDYISIIGISINVFGSVLLAISLNSIIMAFNSSITALEHFKDTILNGGDIVTFTGLDKHRKNALKNNKSITQIGLVMLILGFVLQLVGILLNK